MSKFDIIRAWKDEDFREQLQNQEMLEHPAGIVELYDESLSGIHGGMMGTAGLGSAGCCTASWEPPCTPSQNTKAC